MWTYFCTAEYTKVVMIELWLFGYILYVHIGSAVHGHIRCHNFSSKTNLQRNKYFSFLWRGQQQKTCYRLSFNHHMYVIASFVIQRHNIFSERTKLQQKNCSIFLKTFNVKLQFKPRLDSRQLMTLYFSIHLLFLWSFVGCKKTCLW